MQAVKAIYKEGNIQLLTPLVGVSEAELFVIVLEKTIKRTGLRNRFLLQPPMLNRTSSPSD